MHITKTLVMAAVTLLGLLATTEQIIAQNGFENPAQNDSRMEDSASIDSRPSYSSRLNPSFTPPPIRQTQQSPSQRPPSGTSSAPLPPITSGSPFANELRGSSDSGAKSTSVLEQPTRRFDAQPLPPKPPTSSGQPRFAQPKFSSNNFGGSVSSQPSRSQNPVDASQLPPMERLNPARIVEGLPADEKLYNQVDTQDIPVNETLSSSQASQTTRIPNNSLDDSRVVSSSFTSPPQQPQNFLGQGQQQPPPRQNFQGGGQRPIQQRPVQQQNFSNASQQQQPSRQQPQRTSNQNNLGSSTSSNASKRLLDRYDIESSTKPLPGIPVDLESLLRSTPTRYRLAMVQQYWETYFDWSTLQNRQSHADWMAGLSNPRSQSEQSLLNTAKSMAQNELVAAEIQLARSQSKLQQLAGTNHRELLLLPLPMDQPLVTKYNSHYDWYASRNMIPAKLKGINEMLTRTYELISSRSSTVQQAEAARNQATQAFKSGQLGLSNLLDSGRVWHAAIQGFSSTVVSYNQAISDYALTVTPATKPVSELVTMLVAKPKSINQVAQSNSILNQQQNRTAENRAGQNIGSQNQSRSRQASNTSFNGGQNQSFSQPFNNSTSLAPQGQRIARQNPIGQSGNGRLSPDRTQSTIQNQSSQAGNPGNVGRPRNGSKELAAGQRRGLSDGPSQTGNSFRSPATPPGATAGTSPKLRQRNPGRPPQFQPPSQIGGGANSGGGSSQSQGSNQFGGGSFGG